MKIRNDAIMLFIILAGLLLWPLPGWSEEVELGIFKTGVKKIDLALAMFDAGDDVPEEVSADVLKVILVNDLEISGLFKLSDVSRFKDDFKPAFEENAPINFKKWYLVLSQGLVAASVSVEGDDLVVTGRLYDAFAGKFVMGKRYAGAKKDAREIMHRFADEIIFRFTSVKGIAHTKIAFISTETGKKEIYVMDYDGHNSKQITSYDSITMSPEWMPGNNGLVFTSYIEQNPDVYTLKLGEEKPDKLFGFQGINSAPAYSPDGEKIALTLNKDGNPELYVADADGSNITRLTFNINIDTSPSWAPNSREIVFASDRSGRSQLYIIDADGLNLRRITFDGYANGSPEWSPQGDLIAFSSERSFRSDICLTDIRGKHIKVLTDKIKSGRRVNNQTPSWASDGFHLAFSSDQDGKHNVYMMNIDGSNLKRLTFNKGDNYQPAWSK